MFSQPLRHSAKLGFLNLKFIADLKSPKNPIKLEVKFCVYVCFCGERVFHIHQIHRGIHDYNSLRTSAAYVLATALSPLKILTRKGGSLIYRHVLGCVCICVHVCIGMSGGVQNSTTQKNHPGCS